VPNVALVVLDTLRKDAFDEHFDWLPGASYDDAWASTHWTVGSHASLFTGLYASETGVYGTNPRFDYEGETLAESLSTAGYRTRGFTCNPFITETFDFVRGFDRMRRNWSSRRLDDDIFDWGDFESEHRFQGVLRFPEAVLEVLRSDCRTVPSLKHGLQRKLYFDNSELTDGDKGAKRIARHLRRMTFDDDEFFFTNLMEAHGPYRCPPSYQTVTETNDGASFADVVGFETLRAENTRQAYDDCVRYLASVYEEIHAELRSSFDYVVTVSDHGESLGEDDNWGHNFGVHPVITNVPLSVWSADGSHESLATEAAVGLVDVYATVLGRAGVTHPDGRRGVDLFAATPTTPRLTEYHGLIRPEIAERIERHASPDAVDAYDTWLRGLAVADFYAYETVVDATPQFRERGTLDANRVPTLGSVIADADGDGDDGDSGGDGGGGDDAEIDAREVLEHAHKDLDVRQPGGVAEYTDAVRDELEHLGYL